ncbi:MAG: hypothetical protein ABSB59_29700 [Streptosporangiaceae bacterium]
MNIIEERIRAAARAAADTVTPDSVPDLELPAARSRRLGRRHRPAWTHWAARLAPVAAALAVVTIVITVMTVSPAPHQGGPDLATGTATRPAVPAGPPASSYVRSGQVPPYYVAITAAGAAVRLTASGATVAAIKPSQPGGSVIAVTAAADDRTFVLAEESQELKVSFYEYRLGTSGRPGGPARLPMSVAEAKTLTGVALSPDGTMLALALAPGDSVQQIKLYPVRGGPARTWSATGGTTGGDLSTISLSWTDDQRTLAFDWSGGPVESVRRLDTSSAGGSLLTASHLAVGVPDAAGPGQTLYTCPAGMIITPDGSAVVCPSSGIIKITSDRGETYSTGFPVFATATGRVTRIVGHWPQGQLHDDPTVESVLWSDASGRVLIGVVSSAGRHWIGVISGNKFTPLDSWRTPAGYVFGAW